MALWQDLVNMLGEIGMYMGTREERLDAHIDETFKELDGTRIRRERQEYPNKRFDEAIIWKTIYCH